jgi:hypothetical protein
MTTPDTFPVPDKRVPPAPAVPRRVTARKWTGTLPDKYVATLVELVSPTRLEAAVEALAAFHTRHTFSSNIGPAADWIVGQFTAAGYADVVRRPWTREGHSADNVVCSKPGTSTSGRVVIVCAHYDSRMERLADATARAPGADDNASGVATMLEIARILHDVALRDTLRFVAFSGEEQGLWGSTAYANELAGAGVDVHRLINLDMVGRPPTDGTVTVERDLGNAVSGNDAASQAFGDVMAQATADYTSLPVKLGPIYASDYMPFEAKGYVTIGAYEGEGNPNYHATSDTPATLDFGYHAAVTQLTLATLLDELLDVVDEQTSTVDLYIRDSDADTGAQPSGVPHWTSPDIWVRNVDLADGDDPEFGHQPPINDQPNYLYVRVHNRGTTEVAAGTATVRAYRCDPGTGMVWPADFVQLGTLPVTDPVPAGGAVRVGPFVWTPHILDHECLLAVASAPDDHTIPDVFSGALNHGLLVRYDNNVGQRNVAPQLSVPGGKTNVSLWLRGGIGPTENEFVLDATLLPPDTGLVLRAPARIVEGAQAVDGFTVTSQNSSWVRLALSGGGTGRLSGFPLAPSDRASLRLTVDFSVLAEHRRRYGATVSQFQDAQPAGRLTVEITAVKEVEDLVFGNPRSHELHTVRCAYWPRISQHNKVPFWQIADGLARGYNGCALCLPNYHTG